MSLPSLESVLEYRNPRVLKLYEQNYPAHALSSETAFAETLKYLWLTQKHAQDPTLGKPRYCLMPTSMQEIDDMWHEFILFTQDYMDFCERFFGRYIHHLPNVFDNAPMEAEEQQREIDALLPYIYDNLGEESLRIWFARYLKET